MRSFALWYESDQKESVEVKININLWDKTYKNSKKYCFDFGFLIENIKSINKINLYVPFEVNRDEVKDLGSIIANNKLVNAIFNENFTTTDGEPKRLIVNNSKDSFVIYSLEIDTQVFLAGCRSNGNKPGTILEIDTREIDPSEKNICKYYFRIRVEVNEENIHLIYNEIKGASILSDHFTNTEVIDFRLNDVRSCSDELREKFDSGCQFSISAVHYLILRNANDLIIHYGKEIQSRMLENDLWRDYIDGNTSNIIAYHIKSKAEKMINIDGESSYRYLDSFSDLTRFQYQKGTRLIILLYLVGAIIIGATGGVIGNWVSNIIWIK